MKYIGFDIQNYKGIDKLTLDLATGSKHKIFTLVGLNESGKTTILEALDFFQKEIPDGQEHSVIPKSRKGDFNSSVSVTATLELDSDDEKLIREVAKKAGFKIKDGLEIRTLKIEKRYTFVRSSFDQANSGEYWTTDNILGVDKGGTKVKTLENSKAHEVVIDYIRNNLLPPIIYYPNFLTKFPQRIYLQPRPGEESDQDFYREVLQ